MYANKLEAVADLRDPNSPLRSMGIMKPSDPILDAAFPATSFAAGRYIRGAGDGLSDSIPARIDGRQEAALATGEVVVPADVVADVGNGSSEAGAKKIIQHFSKIRQQKHGTNKQPRSLKGPVMPA
jgi:hypothetical protein